MAVCSNSIRDSLELMIRQAGLRDYFEFLISNEDVTRPKPDPEIYIRAIARMGVTPADAADRRGRSARRRGCAAFRRTRLPCPGLRRGRLLPRARGDRSRRAARPAPRPESPHDPHRRADGRRGAPVRGARVYLPQAAGRDRRGSRSSSWSSKTSRPLSLITSCSCAGRSTCRVMRSATSCVSWHQTADVVTMRQPTAGALCSVLLGHGASREQTTSCWWPTPISDRGRRSRSLSRGRPRRTVGRLHHDVSQHPSALVVRAHGARPGGGRRREAADQPERHRRPVLLPPRNRLRRGRANGC